MSQQETPTDNTHLSKEELEHFRNRLQTLKQEATSKINDLKESVRDLESNIDDTDSSSAHHQGDLGSNEELRETKYTLIEKQQDKLEKITTALDRFESGNYGICIVTGKPIQKERLEAIPYAIHTVEALEGQVEPGGEKNISVSDTA